MTDFGRALVRNEIDAASFGDGGAPPSAKFGSCQTGGAGASNAPNRHAIYCLTLGTLLIGIATGLTFAEHVSTGLVAWLFLSGMLALVLANLVMMEA